MSQTKCFDCKKPATKTFTTGDPDESEEFNKEAHYFAICEECYENNIESIGQEYSLK